MLELPIPESSLKKVLTALSVNAMDLAPSLGGAGVDSLAFTAVENGTVLGGADKDSISASVNLSPLPRSLVVKRHALHSDHTSSHCGWS